MNKILIAFGIASILFLSGFGAKAQIRKIPAEVTDNFTAKFPGASAVEWKDKLTGFTATFKDGDTTYIASFDNKGNWTATEHDIDQASLPEAVQDGFEKSRFADWDVKNIAHIDTPDGDNYRIEVGKGDIKKRNLYFNANGRLLKDKLTL